MAQLSLRRFNIDSLTNPQVLDLDAGWYYGEVVDGKRHGEGIFFWPGGEAYMGSWANDMRNGYGIFRTNNGSMRIGTWLNRRLIGFGVEFNYFAPSGIKFELPDNEEFRDMVGTDFINNHEEWLVDRDNEFGSVFEGVFRGEYADGFGTNYRRDQTTGKVFAWTVGGHDVDYKLDGYGTSHHGRHPAFNTDATDLQDVYTTTGMFNHGELQAGAGRVVKSYWLGDVCIQSIEANGYINEHGFISGPVNVSLDGNTIWSGVVTPDNNGDEEDQIDSFLRNTDEDGDDAADMIYAQRLRTITRIVDEGEDAKSLDSSSQVPTFADAHPLPTWVVDIMATTSESICEHLDAREAEQERLNAGNLEYTKRCKIYDEDGDVVDRMDAVRVHDGKLTLDFEIPFTPTITTSPTTSDDGEPQTLAYIMFGNKIVGMFKYDNTILTVKTDEMTFESDEMYYGEGTRVFIPVTDGGDDFEYKLEVESIWSDSDEYPNDVVTREMLGFNDDDDDEDNDDPEGMDVERDEDGNVTGMGFSMTGANPDQEAQNLNTLLNVFKNGGHFAPIDEIMENAKKSK